MGVLPLQYPEGQNRESLGLTGDEEFTITGITALNDGDTPRTVKVKAGGRRSSTPASGSTPPVRRTTTATAGSCSTCCGPSAARPPDPMDLGLGGRGYLLTGASRGLGFATARALVDDGARVLISSRSADARRLGGRRTRRRARRLGLAADLADPGAADRLVAEARERLGRSTAR